MRSDENRRRVRVGEDGRFGGGGGVLLRVLAEAFFGEHERVRQTRKDHVEGLAEERRGILRSINAASAIMFACVTTGRQTCD